MPLSAESIEEDLEVYGIEVNGGDRIYKKCAEVCKKYALSSEQFAVSWLAYSTSKGLGDLSEDRLALFETTLQKESKSVKENIVKEERDKQNREKEKREKPQDALFPADDCLLAAYGAAQGPAKKNVSTNGIQSELGVSFAPPICSSPLAPSLAQSPYAESPRYAERIKPGTIIASFGAESEEGTEHWIAEQSVVPKVQQLGCGNDGPLLKPYGYMFDKLRDCGDILDDAIYNFGEQMKKILGDADEISCLRVPSNESVWCIGRICCDSVGRLNAASVWLEGDRERDSGQVVSLDLSRLGSYSLFPGQIVAVHGINSTGNKLVAKKIISGQILEPDNRSISLNDKGVYIVVASGPFTISDNLLYEPLTALLNEIRANPPHALILLGPLIDSSHPSLTSASLRDSYDSILRRVIEKIDSAFKGIEIQVFLVASFRDICCHMIFPTPPVFVSGPQRPGTKVQLLPDPSILSIDGVTIALTTNDILMHISKEEITFPPQSSDRFNRLAEHLLLQQSFYPLYPPSEGVCLNLERASSHARLPFTPDVMVLPSAFKGFIKETKDCVIVNPERLAKGKLFGSYTKLMLRPRESNKLHIQGQIIKI